jgi:GrpB-like predicted nucleotidyltransferase (UPF0157 family)
MSSSSSSTTRRSAYVALKLELAKRYRDDRLAYTDAKTEFVEATLGLD